jgi:TM2 domain-containing membrane protein YozV
LNPFRQDSASPPAFPPQPVAQNYTLQTPPKDFVAALLLSGFLGYFGADRFYLGHIGLGIAKLAVCILTCGIGGIIWHVIDFWLLATGNMADGQGRPLQFRTRNVTIV